MFVQHLTSTSIEYRTCLQLAQLQQYPVIRVTLSRDNDFMCTAHAHVDVHGTSFELELVRAFKSTCMLIVYTVPSLDVYVCVRV